MVALLALFACDAAAPSARVVVLGMDGLEYTALDRYAEDLPNFARFFEGALRADMEVTRPIMSPILWTTMASGYGVDQHGVGGWTNGQGRSFTGADVRTERVWDALSGEGRESVVSGWLMTWPAPAIEGALLSDRFVWSVPMSRDPSQPVHSDHREVTTFPDGLATLAAGLLPTEAELRAMPLGYQVEKYGAPSHPLRRDELHVRVFEALWPEQNADFGALYLNGADQVSHIYWPFADPDIQGLIRADPAAHKRAVDEVIARFPSRPMPVYGEQGLDASGLAEASRWVPDYYRYLDSVLGRVMDTVGPDVTLIVCSDHGFQVSQSKPLVDGQHHEIAVFAARGPRVKAQVGATMHVYDVAPTLYALLGLPSAADMPGRVRDDLFELNVREPVASRVLERAQIEVGAGEGGAGDDALREQLEALGYIDEEGRPQTAIGESRKRPGEGPSGRGPRKPGAR